MGNHSFFLKERSLIFRLDLAFRKHVEYFRPFCKQIPGLIELLFKLFITSLGLTIEIIEYL